MQRPAHDPPQNGPPSRPKLFLVGVVGLPAAAALAFALDTLLAGDDRVSKGFFVAAAALTPVVALGLLAQLVAALAGTTRGLLRQLKGWSDQMAAEPPVVSEQSQRDRRAAWEGARDFVHVLTPFVAGLALQLIATEAVALYCLAADVDERVVAIAVGIEIFALFNYLLFFNALLARLARRRRSAAVA